MDECLGRGLFGLPTGRSKMVRDVSNALEQTILFLFNFTARTLTGVFMASGEAGFPLHERAWLPGAWSTERGEEVPPPRKAKGKQQRTPLLAQLPVERVGPELPALPESAFSHVMKYEGDGSHKFSYTLDAAQVEQLVTLCINNAKKRRSRS